MYFGSARGKWEFRLQADASSEECGEFLASAIVAVTKCDNFEVSNLLPTLTQAMAKVAREQGEGSDGSGT